MGYTGISVPITLGQSGLITDDPISSLPLNALNKANNISFENGRISKMQGSTRYNSSALTSDIVALFDWWPASNQQRLIALTDDGKMWRDTGDGTFGTATPIKTGLGALTTDSHFVTGGSESQGRSRKLFALTGVSQIQVLTADVSTPTAISLPSADWAISSYPTFGIQYQNRFAVLNSTADLHRVYFSTLSDHENFSGQTFSTSRWELWSRIAATPNVSRTTAIQAGTATALFTTTANDGYLIYGVQKFDKVTMRISIAGVDSGGAAPAFSYEYWNGSAWSALTTTAVPDYTTLATDTLEFSIPSDWAVGDGTEVGGSTSYYAIRVLATTPFDTTAPSINSLAIANTTFDTAPPTFSVFPGEGDGLISAYVYRGLLFLFKKPFGVYVIDGRDPDTANWTVTKFSDAFGLGSPHAVLQILGDLVAANSMGSITSLQASQNFGDFDAGDVLQNAKVEQYIRNQTSFIGIPYSQSVYYPEKKIALFTAQSTTTLLRDRIIAIDVSRDNSRVYLITKDEPNCLALRKDSQGISRPIYGTQSGYVYLMDQSTYNVNGTPFIGEFQTAYSDFGQVSLEYAGKNKIFDFLEVNYLPTGNNNFSVDIYVDGDFRQTLTFTQFLGTGLDSFVLDVDALTGDALSGRNRKPLKSCTGNKISFRFYNNSSNESFRVERIIVGFRLSAEQVYSTQT